MGDAESVINARTKPYDIPSVSNVRGVLFVMRQTFKSSNLYEDSNHNIVLIGNSVSTSHQG